MGTQETCRRGHPRTPATIYSYPTPNGKIKVVCRVCKEMRHPPKKRNTKTNDYRLYSQYACILLQNGQEAIVDADDVERVQSCGRWVHQRLGYVTCSTLHISLHRFITSAPKGSVVDHINRNPLDCRKENLRVIDQRRNTQNQSLEARSTRSGYKNVHWEAAVNRWKVRVRHHGKVYSGGYFSNLEDAIKKASVLRKQLHECCPENSLPDNG